MRVYGASGIITSDVKVYKNGITSFSIGMGKENGFCKITWFKDTNFLYKPEKSDYVVIPCGNLKLSKYTNSNGEVVEYLEMTTKYLEKQEFLTTGKTAKKILDKANETLQEVEKKEKAINEFKQEEPIRIDPILQIAEFEVSKEIEELANKEFGEDDPKIETVDWEE